MPWHLAQAVGPRRFQCGFCNNVVSSDRGWQTAQAPVGYVYVCPHCDAPTYFAGTSQVPGVVPGAEVKYLPDGIEKLYREARRAVSVDASTAAVLAARKLLMHIAVEQGAKAGETFLAYVEYLAAQGYVPPNGRGWVDHIRAKGNEANHQIVLMTSGDASELLAFVEMLLKFIYEFPNRVPKPKAP
jgi:Domain of unknown function (DUF4145)